MAASQQTNHPLTARSNNQLHMKKHSFAPVANAQTRLLVLGSLPGDASLAQNQYYGHPQNQFWRLMSAVIGADLRAVNYDSRLQLLLDHGVGLWDVIANADREGSLDSRIKKETHNDLASLLSTLPILSAIAFNGATAARHGQRSLSGWRGRASLILLPSSSPAYTRSFDEKLAAWLALKEFL